MHRFVNAESMLIEISGQSEKATERSTGLSLHRIGQDLVLVPLDVTHQTHYHLNIDWTKGFQKEGQTYTCDNCCIRSERVTIESFVKKQ